MSTKTLITASWKLPSSPSGAPGAPDMVNASRDQSQEAPRRFNCPMIVPRERIFCCQTRAVKASRPISTRVGSPCAAMSRSVTICVAMPA